MYLTTVYLWKLLKEFCETLKGRPSFHYRSLVRNREINSNFPGYCAKDRKVPAFILSSVCPQDIRWRCGPWGHMFG